MSLARVAIRSVQRLISFRLPAKVMNGLFEGAPLEKNYIGSSLLPKQLGTYESELAPDIQRIVTLGNCDSLLDIGCAGGYYISVCHYLNPKLYIRGIDISQKSAAAIQRYCVKYKVNVDLKVKAAEADDIYSMCAEFKRPLIIIDIEGSEFSLFSEFDFSRARNAFFVVEVHPQMQIDSDEIAKIFTDTHNVKIVKFINYSISEKTKVTLQALYRLIRIHELRDPSTYYLIIQPK